MAHYLVTGGAGFIGSNLVDELVANHHLVTVFDDLSTGFGDNVNPQARFCEGDVRDAVALNSAMQGSEVVFHLAASVGNLRSIQAPGRDAAVNLLGTINVLEASREHGIRKVVFSSSAAIFGEPEELPIAEEHPRNPDSPYGVSKLAAERDCLVFNDLFGMRNVCLRYFNVYGHRQRFDAYGNVIPIFGEQALAGDELTVYGDGEQTRDFVHVRDVVAANISAADSPRGGAFNIGSGSKHTVSQLVAYLDDMVPGGVRVRHAPARAGEVRDSLADVSAAQQHLAYSPDTDLRGGLRDYLAWLESDPLSIAARTAHD